MKYTRVMSRLPLESEEMIKAPGTRCANSCDHMPSFQFEFGAQRPDYDIKCNFEIMGRTIFSRRIRLISVGDSVYV